MEREPGSPITSDDITPPQPIPLPVSAQVINVGLALLGEATRDQGADVVDVEWRIPAGGEPALVQALTFLYDTAAAPLEEANREVVRRLDEGKPVLHRISPAGEVIPDIDERTILHPGPPLEWSAFCDPLRRSVHAAIMAEGWASTPEDAERLIVQGEAHLQPANEHATVLPMATVLGPSAPVFVVENPQGETRSYSAINQGPGKVPWFGVETPEATDRLRWLRDVASPLLNEALTGVGPVDIFSVAAQGLQMGDDVHMRTQASTNLLIRHLLPALVALDDTRAPDLARFLSANHLFFLNLAMAAAKSIVDWAAEVPGSSIVLGMARNGTTFGIRMGGMEGRWFTAPAPPVGDALYYSGFGADVAAPDIGDSAVLELVGLGGAAAAASPAIASFLGGSMARAMEETRNMERICAGQSTRFKLAPLNFRGSPIGVDARAVVELDLTPAINTGILHASDGVGQIGAGVARAPLAPFREALLALVDTYRDKSPISR